MNQTIADTIRRTYYTHLRPDILSLVPVGARRALSIGCGAGVTEGELVKAGVEVVGIEMNAGAARAARERGLEVLVGDAAELSDALWGNQFDCLIYADVLEHMLDPLTLLRQHVALLRDGGTVIVSVPNFRYAKVLWQLAVRGAIQYTDGGVLDRTHMRMTTRKMVLGWFAAAGVRPTSVRYNRGGRLAARTWRFLPSIAKEFVATQVVLAGRKGPAA